MKNKNLYNNIKANNIFSEVINEQPDEQQPLQYTSYKSIVNPNPGQVINNQTSIQRRVQRIQDSQLNLILLETKNVIKIVKQKIQKFASDKVKRQVYLREFNKNLQQLSGMLNYCVGMDNSIKIFILRKIFNILKGMKKIQEKQYQKFMSDILEQQKILNKKKQQKNRQRHDQKVRCQVKTQKSQAFTNLKQSILHKCLKQSSKNEEKELKDLQQIHFNQAFQRVNIIYEKNLKAWFKHTQDLKQLNQFDNDIKYLKNTYLNKSLHNRNIILKRASSLKVVPNNRIQDDNNKNRIKQNQQNENKQTDDGSRNLLSGAHSLVSLYEEQRKFKPKKHVQHALSFKSDVLGFKSNKNRKQNFPNQFGYDVNRNSVQSNYRRISVSEPRSNSYSSVNSEISKIKLDSKLKLNKKQTAPKLKLIRQ